LFKIHFLAGLPRSGSTLLAAILRQNPAFHAAMSSSLAEVFLSALRTMSMSETSLFLSDAQRARILAAIVEAYYCDAADRTVIDTGRIWPSYISSLALLFPGSRIICCVRNPAWVVDSVERLVQRNSLLVSRMFGPEVNNVYARAEALVKSGFLGVALHALRQAWFGEHAGMLIAVQYDSLVANPGSVIGKLYDLLGEEDFSHDFRRVEYDEPEFDARLNMPGLHRVAGPVEVRERSTILPPELFGQFDGCFWNEHGQNPRGVMVL
jgi:sulfotransferase